MKKLSIIMLLIAFSVTACSTGKSVTKSKPKDNNQGYACAKW
jgi:hypothetical protein